MRRIFPILLALLFLGGCTPAAPLPAPAPTPTPVPTQDLQGAQQSFALPYYPNQELHPITGQNRTNLALMPLVYEGLFAHDAAGVPQGVLCTGQTVSEDGLTWTFSIRTGVTFSDGSPLTPADAVDSLRLAKGENSSYAARLAGVSGITAGEGTVVLTLTSPNGNLPALLDIPIVRAGAGGTLGTGPYGFSGGGEALTLTANPGWWQKKALPLEEIALYAVQGADGLIHAFDTGAVSLVTADLTGTNALGYSGSYEVWDYPTSVMLYIGYNTKSGPCKDPAVRKALSYGYERAAVAKSLLARHATAAALPVPPESPLYDRSLADRLEYAPQTMAELL
ncbi:MAG: ABC transporter substrate-binding protein, partial [Pseudoflavonifractor sp.]